MADTEDMNREGAETYLRLLAEATMRRSLDAAREQPGSPDPGGYRARLLTVGHALTAVEALDPVTAEEILTDFSLAMKACGSWPTSDQEAVQARAIRVAHAW